MLIDEKINKYWSLQRCDIVSGMRSVNDSKSEMLLEKNICSKYFIDDKPLKANPKCYQADVNQFKKTISFKPNLIKKPNKQTSFSNIITLIVVLIISLISIVVLVNVILKRHYHCKKPCFHINFKRKNNSKFFKILTSLSDDAFTNENEDEDENVNGNGVEYDRGGSNGVNESVILCKFNLRIKNKNAYLKVNFHYLLK
jgi:hypothetical protein